MTETFSPAKVAEEALRLISASISEVVPPEAQLHLISAQRELLLAIAITIEHNAQRTVKQPRAKRRSPRAEHIELEDDSAAPPSSPSARAGSRTRAAKPKKISLD